jgi:hypothetical protein
MPATRSVASFLALLLAAALIGCRSDRGDLNGRGNDSAVDPDSAGAARARLGVVFEPARAVEGDSVAGLRVQRLLVERVTADSIAVGTIVFRGQMELTGTLIRHPEPDADAVCFESDSASAARMPRWRDDRRRPWFCFANTARARAVFGAGGDDRRWIVRVEAFTINRGLTDQVNTARLIEGRAAPPGQVPPRSRKTSTSSLRSKYSAHSSALPWWRVSRTD